MTLKKLLKTSTGLMLICASLMPSFAQAEEYITKSQINVPNGVAGLNANKDITANIKNDSIYTSFLMLTNKGLLRFDTGDNDPNNKDINLSYNKDATTDPWGNILEANTFYFTNHHGGNNYKFVGNVSATSQVSAHSILVNGKSVESAIDKANNSFPNSYQLQNPYSINDESPLIVMDDSNTGYDTQNIRKNTLMLGGETPNSSVGIKATCQNTSGGDLGGSCYQFTDMSGSQGGHRSGNGQTDGTNVELRTRNNSPLDVIGGNKLVKDGNGEHDYKVEGNDYKVVSNAASGSSQIQIKGNFGCGVRMNNLTGCQMTGIDLLDPDDNVVTSVKVTPGAYNPVNDITIINFPQPDKNKKAYRLKNNLTAGDTVKITFYSADGQAYALRMLQSNVEIYPALSTKEMALIQPRMAIWTNIANGMLSTEDKTSLGMAIDMPNYYYGYYSAGAQSILNSENKKYTYSKLNIEAYYYPSTGGAYLWRNLNTPNIKDGTQGIPGKNNGDSLDYTLNYTEPGTTNKKYNSNYHRYSQPALFLGLSNKNFNTYMIQEHNPEQPDSITREYDNQWDFWMISDKDYSVNSHGLTMSWGGSPHRLTAGSYMQWLAGFNVMPLGLRIDGVWQDGGKLIETDGGFSVFKWTWNSPAMDKIGGEQVITALGQAQTRNSSYQLFSYMSNDGSANNSLHFGMTKSAKTLQYNHSPTCNNNEKCTVLGQVIFDPLGYIGGIALGSGQGENTKLGLIVDKDSNIIVNNKLTVNGKSVNDVIDNAVLKTQINMPNGIVSLNANKDITANIKNDSIYTSFLMLTNKGLLRFDTGDNDPNNKDINLSYNKDATTDPWGNMLDANTFYFTNHHGGNNYKFVGNVSATNTVSGLKFKAQLSTPSSSSESCVAGEFKDDTNYHYVCVGTNKWKRVALSDF